MSKSVFLLLFLFFLVNCNKPEEIPEPELPNLTHKGKNTFGCYLDGEPFVARTDFTFTGPIAVSGSFNEESKLLRIQGTRENENEHYENIAFKVIVDSGVNDYVMNVETSHFKGYLDSSGDNCFYYHDTLNRGSVEITYINEIQNIIAGRFALNLVNNDCNKTMMHITDGRFDFGY